MCVCCSLEQQFSRRGARDIKHIIVALRGRIAIIKRGGYCLRFHRHEAFFSGNKKWLNWKFRCIQTHTHAYVAKKKEQPKSRKLWIMYSVSSAAFIYGFCYRQSDTMLLRYVECKTNVNESRHKPEIRKRSVKQARYKIQKHQISRTSIQKSRISCLLIFISSM